MSHITREFGINSGIRVGQGLALGHAVVSGVMDGLADMERQRAAEELTAVEAVSRELRRVRRLLAGAQAEAARAEQEAAVLREEVALAAGRAARAEHALARVLQAIHA